MRLQRNVVVPAPCGVSARCVRLGMGTTFAWMLAYLALIMGIASSSLSQHAR